MKKLIKGIVQFRKNVQEGYRTAFGKLATGQDPDTLFIACSDSRVVPNTFASTDPGDLFVIRNVGNLIPCCDQHKGSEAAAIEFSLKALNVSDIVVCGHSECGAMQGLLDAINKDSDIGAWLTHAQQSLSRLNHGESLNPSLSKQNQLSQINVLQQLENLKSYPEIQERMKNNKLFLHAWWFDIGQADVYTYDLEAKKFVLIDETQAEKLLSGL